MAKAYRGIILDDTSEIALHRQLTTVFRDAILSGKLQAGERVLSQPRTLRPFWHLAQHDVVELLSRPFHDKRSHLWICCDPDTGGENGGRRTAGGIMLNVSRIFVLFALTLAMGAAYARMAPLGQYLDGNSKAEMALARSAAPPSISDHARVLVLTPHGYVTAERGTNGFTCLVERSWTKAFDDDNFWNPKVRSPVCYNAPASRTVLPYTLFATDLALSGASEASIHERLSAAIADKRLPLPENGSLGYMMSKDAYIDDHVKAWHPHVMVYTPRALGADSGASWGADLDGSPVVYDSNHRIWPQPWALFFIPVSHWSDGTPGPLLTMQH